MIKKCVTREELKCQKGKTLTSLPLMGTPELQLFTGRLLMKKTRTYQIFYNYRYKENTTTGWAREIESQNTVRLFIPEWATHEQEKIINADIFLKGARGLIPILDSSAQEFCAKKTSPRTFGFEGQQGLLSRDQKADRNSTFKRRT